MAMSPSAAAAAAAAAATMLASDSYLADLPLFPDFEGGFTPWDNNSSIHDDHPMYMSFLQTHHHHHQQSLLLHSPVSPNSGSLDEPQSCPPPPTPPPPVSAVDERKQRRMISNRLSARRSRMRKQEHLDNLRNLENQLRIENREITNRLGFVTHRCYLLRRDNDRLRSESIALRRRLSDISQILTLRQLQHHLLLSSSSSQCNSFSSINEVNEQSQLPSLIA